MEKEDKDKKILDLQDENRRLSGETMRLQRADRRFQSLLKRIGLPSGAGP